MRHEFAPFLDKLGYRPINLCLLSAREIARFLAENQCAETQRLGQKILNECKFHFINHSQDCAAVLKLLNEGICTTTNGDFKKCLVAIHDEIKKAELQFTPEISLIRNKQLAARYFESQWANHLLTNADAEVWQTVNKISKKLISIFESLKSQPAWTQSFLSDLGENPLPFAFHHFNKKVSLDDVIKVLKNQNNLAQTLLIHHLFIRDVYQELPSTLGNTAMELKNKVPSLAQLCAEQFAHSMLKRDEFCNGHFYRSAMFANRGRADVDNDYWSSDIGIMQKDQSKFDLPALEMSWMHDAETTTPDLNAGCVQNSIQHDIPYVAGPSGMTAYLLSGMTLIGKFNNLADKRNYIVAIAAFIVGGGLHSLHEVLSVAQERLWLLDKYNSTGNYSDFFALFSDNHCANIAAETAWKKLLSLVEKPAQKNDARRYSCVIS